MRHVNYLCVTFAIGTGRLSFFLTTFFNHAHGERPRVKKGTLVAGPRTGRCRTPPHAVPGYQPPASRHGQPQVGWGAAPAWQAAPLLLWHGKGAWNECGTAWKGGGRAAHAALGRGQRTGEPREGQRSGGGWGSGARGCSRQRTPSRRRGAAKWGAPRGGGAQGMEVAACWMGTGACRGSGTMASQGGGTMALWGSGTMAF